MEVTNYSSKAVGGTGLGLGIAGTALGLLNGGLGNLLGGVAGGCGCGCSEDHLINRYEAGQSAEIARLNTELKLRDANTYTDQKALEMYQYIDGRLRTIEGQICAQNVYNATNTAAIGCINGQIAQLMSLTQISVPATKVCPQPMPLYNSWAAPSAPTTAAAG